MNLMKFELLLAALIVAPAAAFAAEATGGGATSAERSCREGVWKSSASVRKADRDQDREDRMKLEEDKKLVKEACQASGSGGSGPSADCTTARATAKSDEEMLKTARAARKAVIEKLDAALKACGGTPAKGRAGAETADDAAAGSNTNSFGSFSRPLSAPVIRKTSD
jgi:hypothetical protein